MRRGRHELSQEELRQRQLCECGNSHAAHQGDGHCVAAGCTCREFRLSLVIPAAVPWKPGDPDDDVPF